MQSARLFKCPGQAFGSGTVLCLRPLIITMQSQTLMKAPRSLPSAAKHNSKCSARRAVSVRAQAGPSNPIGIHAQVWVGDWSKDEAVKAISGTKKAGYDLIELNVSVPEAVDAAMTKSVLKDHDLGASASLGLSVETDISNPDPAIHNKGVELLKKSMKVLHEVGGKHFVGVNYCAMNKYKGPKTKEQWDTVVRNLKELANVANDLGLEYGLEVVNRYETNLLNTAYQAMELVDAVGAPNIGVHLDTYHMNIEENNFGNAIKLCGDKLQYFHVGESHRGYLGTGSVDWTRMWGGLAAADFQGPITFESFSSAVVSPSLSNTLCVWRDLWDNSEDLATKAREFIGSGLYSAYRTHKH